MVRGGYLLSERRRSAIRRFLHCSVRLLKSSHYGFRISRSAAMAYDAILDCRLVLVIVLQSCHGIALQYNVEALTRVFEISAFGEAR